MKRWKNKGEEPIESCTVTQTYLTQKWPLTWRAEISSPAASSVHWAPHIPVSRSHPGSQIAFLPHRRVARSSREVLAGQLLHPPGRGLPPRTASLRSRPPGQGSETKVCGREGTTEGFSGIRMCIRVVQTGKCLETAAYNHNQGFIWGIIVTPREWIL